MEKRKVIPVFMLPENFPNGTDEIYVVYSGCSPLNLRIHSASEFNYHDMSFFGRSELLKSNQKHYRADDLSVTSKVIEDLVSENNAIIDWTQALEQGQSLVKKAREFMGGDSIKSDLRKSRGGEMYLHRDKVTN